VKIQGENGGRTAAILCLKHRKEPQKHFLFEFFSGNYIVLLLFMPQHTLDWASPGKSTNIFSQHSLPNPTYTYLT
jgi:hypothetical protein